MRHNLLQAERRSRLVLLLLRLKIIGLDTACKYDEAMNERWGY
jgi:hypothetical protein